MTGATVGERLRAGDPSVLRLLHPGVLLAISAVALAASFHDGLEVMVMWWLRKEEYSHGFMIPMVSAYLAWQRREAVAAAAGTGSWAGVGILLLGLALGLIGELGTVYVLVQYGFVVALAGTLLAVMGARAFRVIAMPVALLLFMIPLPNFLYNNLSSQLQLISSQLGVEFIRLCNVSVYLEGNIIDLGTYQLQVAEACNGLRYLFPLMTIGFIIAYLYQAALWKRVVVFLSTIPITVLMNSLRVGIIGVMVEYWGVAAAEGFLHDFEGWAVFMVCFAILLLEAWLLLRFGDQPRSLRAVFRLDFPGVSSGSPAMRPRALAAPPIAAVLLLSAAAIPVAALPVRTEITPAREPFLTFPLELGAYRGRRDYLSREVAGALGADDYLIADYSAPGRGPVNLFMAYYDSQQKGRSVHSPRSCIPGGGWRIESLEEVTVEGASAGAGALRVNRVEIASGDARQLVYYWFQQRGRTLTNEYIVKWFILWDSVRSNRSDGALVRLTTVIPSGGDVAAAEQLLAEFAAALAPRLTGFIPD
jgi:exosortase D (VPLPA-CTERM-specific)